MIERLVIKHVVAALQRQAAVALIGPRQVGKATVALPLAAERPSIYLDLESRSGRERLEVLQKIDGVEEKFCQRIVTPPVLPLTKGRDAPMRSRGIPDGLAMGVDVPEFGPVGAAYLGHGRIHWTPHPPRS